MRIKLLFTKEDYEKLKQCKENGYRSGCSVMSCGGIGCDVCPLSGLLIDERLEYVKNRLEEENNLEPVRHGKWIMDKKWGTAICSECKFEIEDDYFWRAGDFRPWEGCPICRSKMDGEVEE